MTLQSHHDLNQPIGISYLKKASYWPDEFIEQESRRPTHTDRIDNSTNRSYLDTPLFCVISA